MADHARNTALFILNTLDERHKTLDRVLEEDITDKEQYLSKRDRALVNALVYGVIRRRGTLDWIIDYFSNTRLNAIDDPVDLLSSQKNRHNILCAMLEHAALYCILIFKIGVNQQSHRFEYF